MEFNTGSIFKMIKNDHKYTSINTGDLQDINDWLDEYNRNIYVERVIKMKKQFICRIILKMFLQIQMSLLKQTFSNVQNGITPRNILSERIKN